MPLDNTPVLIGAGQFTYRGDPLASPSPLSLLKTAAERAVRDAGLDASALAQLDAVEVVGFTVDAPGGLAGLPIPRISNPPAALARPGGPPPGPRCASCSTRCAAKACRASRSRPTRTTSPRSA